MVGDVGTAAFSRLGAMTTHAHEPSDGLWRAAVVVTIVGALGSLAMSVAHAGVTIPLFSALGPQGNRAIWPAAGAFAVGTVLYAVTAYGLARRRAWSWAAGIAVHALTLLSAAFPYRGVGSLAGIVVAGSGLVLLMLPAVRAVLLPSRSSPDLRR